MSQSRFVVTMGCDDVYQVHRSYQLKDFFGASLENIMYYIFIGNCGWFWGLKLMEFNSNLFSRYGKKHKFERKAGMISRGF